MCPSVLLLRKFYDFALELETALCELLTVLCSPEMTALQHLEKQQVRRVCVGGGGGGGGVGGTGIIKLSMSSGCSNTRKKTNRNYMYTVPSDCYTLNSNT